MAIRINTDEYGQVTVPVKVTFHLTEKDLVASLVWCFKQAGTEKVPATRTELVTIARGAVRKYGQSCSVNATKGVPSSVVRNAGRVVRELIGLAETAKV